MWKTHAAGMRRGWDQARFRANNVERYSPEDPRIHYRLPCSSTWYALEGFAAQEMVQAETAAGRFSLRPGLATVAIRLRFPRAVFKTFSGSPHALLVLRDLQLALLLIVGRSG